MSDVPSHPTRGTAGRGSGQGSPAPITGQPQGMKTAKAVTGKNGASAYPETVQRLIDEFATLPGIGRRSAERLAFHILKAETPDALNLARAISDVKRTVRHCGVCFNLADGADHRAASPPPSPPLSLPTPSTTDTPGTDTQSTPASLGSPSIRPETRVVLCGICASPARDHSLVMVVEQPKDLIALEQTGMYKGVYHVLMGRISPLDGVGPGDVTIAELVSRVRQSASNSGTGTGRGGGGGGVRVREVILALNPTLEADGTALYIAEQLTAKGTDVKVTRLARGLPTGSQLEFANKAVLADAIEGRR